MIVIRNGLYEAKGLTLTNVIKACVRTPSDIAGWYASKAIHPKAYDMAKKLFTDILSGKNRDYPLKIIQKGRDYYKFDIKNTSGVEYSVTWVETDNGDRQFGIVKHFRYAYSTLL